MRKDVKAAIQTVCRIISSVGWFICGSGMATFTTYSGKVAAIVGVVCIITSTIGLAVLAARGTSVDE